MRPTSLLALATLLLLPPSAAADSGLHGLKATDRLADQDGEIQVSQRLELRLDNLTRFRAHETINFTLAPGSDGDPSVTVSVGNETQPIVAPRLDRAGAQLAPPSHTYRANLSGLFPSLADGDLLVLLVNHTVAGSDYQTWLHYAFDQLVVYVTPQGEGRFSSPELREFTPTLNGNEQHAIASGVPEGYSYRLEFVGPGDLRDLNTYVYGGIGILIGFLLAWFLFKRGSKPKKFEKGGEMESHAMLEARRRTLMAALRELELAHEAKEIPDAAYAPLKEEYKAQTVRVLRTLDEKKETPKT